MVAPGHEDDVIVLGLASRALTLPRSQLGAVLEVGADALMFSVDYPYESSYEAVAGFERTTLSEADREKIAHGNAERLLRIS